MEGKRLMTSSSKHQHENLDVLSVFYDTRYMEMHDTKEFFLAAKKSTRLVVHFYRGVTPRCQIVDSHFERLAHDHVETRFLKIDAEK
jgi:hypothetical protein